MEPPPKKKKSLHAICEKLQANAIPGATFSFSEKSMVSCLSDTNVTQTAYRNVNGVNVSDSCGDNVSQEQSHHQGAQYSEEVLPNLRPLPKQLEHCANEQQSTSTYDRDVLTLTQDVTFGDSIHDFDQLPKFQPLNNKCKESEGITPTSQNLTEQPLPYKDPLCQFEQSGYVPKNYCVQHFSENQDTKTLDIVEKISGIEHYDIPNSASVVCERSAKFQGKRKPTSKKAKSNKSRRNRTIYNYEKFGKQMNISNNSVSSQSLDSYQISKNSNPGQSLQISVANKCGTALIENILSEQNSSTKYASQEHKYLLPKCNQAVYPVPDSLNKDEEQISCDKTEKLCMPDQCIYNAFPGIHLDKVQGIMKRTPFLACKLCMNPYLNIGALLKHLVKKHNLIQNKHHGIHICVTQAATYFQTSEVRSSDLPMEFRGMCWLSQCEYGCSLGLGVTSKEDKIFKPVACKGCRMPFGSVAGVVQHIEKDHDLPLLRYYLHICPEIYRKNCKDQTEETRNSSSQIGTGNNVLDINGEMGVHPSLKGSVKNKGKQKNVKVIVSNLTSESSDLSMPDVSRGIPQFVTTTTTSSSSILNKDKHGSVDPNKDQLNQLLVEDENNSEGSVSPNRHVEAKKNSDTANEQTYSGFVSDSEDDAFLNQPRCSVEKCSYGCTTKEKYVRGVKMAHIIACKKCHISFYALGSFLNHMDNEHASVRTRLHHYLHICCTIINQYFEEIKEFGKKQPIMFFRRWYFYDKCRGDVCEFGCEDEKPFACKVCRFKFSTDTQVVKHIDELHDRVSIKPLLHVCPSMLGDPPVGPIGEANKYKAITHHSFVPIYDDKKFATPIRPIQRKPRKNPVIVTATCKFNGAMEDDNTGSQNSNFSSPEESEKIQTAEDMHPDDENSSFKSESQIFQNIKVKSEPPNEYKYEQSGLCSYSPLKSNTFDDSSTSFDPFMNVKMEKDDDNFDTEDSYVMNVKEEDMDDSNECSFRLEDVYSLKHDDSNGVDTADLTGRILGSVTPF